MQIYDCIYAYQLWEAGGAFLVYLLMPCRMEDNGFSLRGDLSSPALKRGHGKKKRNWYSAWNDNKRTPVR